MPTPPSPPTRSSASSGCRATTPCCSPAPTSTARKSNAPPRRLGKTPQEFTRRHRRRNSAKQWELLGPRSRPLPSHHRARSITKVVQELFERCLQNGYIYKGIYTGQYCVFDELYVNDAKPGDPCPDCGRPTETVTEENFFFKLSAFQDRLLELYEQRAGFHSAGDAPQRSDLVRQAGPERSLHQPHHIKWGIPVPVEGNARLLRLVRRADRLHERRRRARASGRPICT